jgi:hypothetical protein
MLVKWSLSLCGYFVFFYKTGLRGPARHEVSPWARAWAEGQARGLLRHGTAGTRAKLARHATARAQLGPGPGRPDPARWPSIVYFDSEKDYSADSGRQKIGRTDGSGRKKNLADWNFHNLVVGTWITVGDAVGLCLLLDGPS